MAQNLLLVASHTLHFQKKRNKLATIISRTGELKLSKTDHS